MEIILNFLNDNLHFCILLHIQLRELFKILLLMINNNFLLSTFISYKRKLSLIITLFKVYHI